MSVEVRMRRIAEREYEDQWIGMRRNDQAWVSALLQTLKNCSQKSPANPTDFPRDGQVPEKRR